MNEPLHRVANFNPGPSALPLPVLHRLHEELLDFRGTGMSILEHSHRGPAYSEVHEGCLRRLRKLLAVPDSHEVLLMQGGASAQFALVPMHFLKEGTRAEYLVTGAWAKKALQEAQRIGEARALLDTAEQGVYRRVPKPDQVRPEPGAAYLHLTSNNTIAGTQFHELPEPDGVPLVVDASSDVLARPLPMERIALLYAGAQKNLGPAGVTLVVVRRDWLARAREDLPRIFRYQTFVDGGSRPNTPPVFAIHTMGLLLEWIEQQGGPEAMFARNRRKAERLYAAVDARPAFYRCPVEPASRSLTNAVFRLPNEELEARFVAEAAERGLHGLKGHRSVGGIRVSMYNAVEEAWVERLVAFMEDFAAAHG